MYIIVGLGNPGEKYKYTKHNVGFMTIDYLASQHGISVSKIKHKAVIGEGTVGGEKVVLAKPQTFMNLSGESVMELLHWYKVDVSRLIVIYDDIDLPIGKLRIRPNGSSGTHNGMRSIIYLLNSQDFPRVRIGIGGKPDYMDLADYVISNFHKDDIPIMAETVEKAAKAVEEIASRGINSAMNKYNK
ncbi:MAG: aminoacyl-tRNA hydrolase [Bacillota bacterium]